MISMKLSEPNKCISFRYELFVFSLQWVLNSRNYESEAKNPPICHEAGLKCEVSNGIYVFIIPQSLQEGTAPKE